MKITKNNLEDVFKSEKKDIRASAGKVGLQYVENLFADSSGFGEEGEAALTIAQFKKKIAELVEQYGTIYTYITEAGQFQVNMGVYIKPGEPQSIKGRLEYLRGEIREERISYEELAELQSLAAHIEPGDVELLEAAGVPEFAE